MKLELHTAFRVLVPGFVYLLTGMGCQPEAPSPVKEHVHYVVGLSPFLDEAENDIAFRHIMELLIEDMPLNSSLWMYDAYHVQTIAQVEIPNRQAFQSSRTRVNQFAGPIRALKTFLATPHTPPAFPDLDFHQAIRLPQFLDFVGANRNGTNGSVVTILLGGPLYLDSKEPGFSMVEGYFPSDGHLAASREKSVFGLKERADSLRNVEVHFGYFGDPWMNEIHQQRVARFWNLFLQGQGSRLVTFAGDLPTVFNAVRKAPAPRSGRTGQEEIDPAQSKIEMLRISREVGVADWITRDLPAGPRPRPPTATTGPMKIGIRWEGDIDLDLYSKPHASAETLFFQHTRSREGYYYKDHRSSPDREYEFIEFTAPVDIREARAQVNYYEGATPGSSSGEVRIEFEGRIYSGRFSIDADHGNQGRSGRGQDRYWTMIDIPELLGLR